MVPNQEKKGDYFENPCSSPLMDELYFSGKWWKKKHFLCNQSINSFTLMSRISLWCLILKKGFLIDRWTLILKNSGKKSFLNETKASMSFIPMKRKSLCCLVMKRKDIIMPICICPNWQWTLILKMVDR